MAENEKFTDQLPIKPARDRAQQIQASVNSLFRHCENTDNPVLSFSRACSKVGYLARDGVRGDLFHVVSALNEHKHALLAHRYQQPEEARKHITQRDRDLRSFGAAVRRELAQPRQPPSTPELRERIQLNLDAGQWSRARSDIELLSQRADIGPPLRPVDTYARSWNLSHEHHKLLQDSIDTCNAAARSLGQRPETPLRDVSERAASRADPRGSLHHEDRQPEASRHLAQSAVVPQKPVGKGHESLSTPELHEHIQGSLTRGSWSQAVAGIDALVRRGDNDRELRGLSTYERSDRLDPTFAQYLQDRIEGCNAALELKHSLPQCHDLTLGARDAHRAPTHLVHAQNAHQRASSMHALVAAPESTVRSSPQLGVASRDVQTSPSRSVQLPPSKDRGLDR